MTWTTLPRSELTSSLSGWQGGSGPSALLIHGVGLRAEAWGAMIPQLSKHFHVTAPDLPGHGESSPLKAAQDKGLHPFTDCMAELLEHLPGPTLVIGHSLGALISLDLTIRHPDHVAAVVPLNAIYRRTQKAADAVQVRAAELVKSPNADPSPTVERWFGKDPQGDLVPMAEHCRSWLTAGNPQGYARAYHVFAHADGPSDEALAELQRPSLFITGADEPNSTPEMSRAMARLAPQGRAVVIENARHMMPMTHAKNVADHIIAFHQQLGSGHV